MRRRNRDWQLNASTGNHILRLSDDMRVIRIPGPSYLYYVECWANVEPGDPPRRGVCRGTLQAAKQDGAHFSKKVLKG